MALELAEVVAGFPAAASFAIASGITALREGRRRTALNEAVHELRRPLQVLALSLPADTEEGPALDSSLRMAAAAVERLEREINGGRIAAASTPLSLRSVVESAVARWQARAALSQRPLSLSWTASDPVLQGDGIELGQVVDNLISNAFEHGEGGIVVEVREEDDALRLVVLDDGARAPSPLRDRRGRRSRLGGRDRHGHGLRVVRRLAARHGGSFELSRSPRGTEARLELPLREGTR